MEIGSANEGSDIGGLLPEIRANQHDAAERTNERPLPKGMSDEEADGARVQAMALVDRLARANGSEEMEILEGAINVGLQAQISAAGKLDLLKARTYTFLDEGGPSEDIASGLQDLRLVLDEINPKGVTQPSIANRMLTVVPFFKGRYNPIARALKRIAIRYEPASRQVAVIESRLQEGRALLVRDNVELRLLYEQVEEQQPRLSKNAYLGELLVDRLTEIHENTSDLAKKDRIQSAISDIITRVQDLTLMGEVNLQYMVSVDLTRQNNNRLGQSVYRTITLANNVVMVGLAIQSALIRQRRVQKAAQETRAFLGDLVASNAAAIKQHTLEVGDIYNSPVIAMDKISQAHDDLLEALQIASRLRQEGIDSARVNIVELGRMSAKLEEKISGAINDDEVKSQSLEA